MLVLLNGITVDKNVTLTGGGGGGGGIWAEKNNTIGGNLTISDVTPDWLGVRVQHDRGQREPVEHHRPRPGRLWRL